MKYEFFAYGHPNVLSIHKMTLEFTKDTKLTKRGDCIVGVNADFEFEELEKFLACKRITLTITAGEITERITAVPNPDFRSNHEMVIRKTDFFSERTFAIKADKAAIDMDKRLVAEMKKDIRATIMVENI